MKKFTVENTRGYTQSELDALNAEWDSICQTEGLEPHTPEYYERAHAFEHEVSKRRGL